MNEIDEILTRVDERAKAGDRDMIVVKSSPLSEERETASFALYLTGLSIHCIAEETGIPKEVLAVTARHRNWIGRRKAFARDSEDIGSEMYRRFVNTVYAIASFGAQRELRMVLRGERDPAQCRFIPKTLDGMKEAFEEYQRVNKIEAPTAPTANISAKNVQVIFGEKPLTKAELLERLANHANIPDRPEDK